ITSCRFSSRRICSTALSARAFRARGARKSKRTRTNRRRRTDMAEAHPILLAALVGFACAVVFSCLPGPINLTILNEGAQRGFKWGFFIGLGAPTMDGVYCSISFTGISQFIDHGFAQTMMRLMGFVFLLFLGFKFLFSNLLSNASPLDLAIGKLEERIEQKVHPHSAFATGFVRVAANLGVLGAWVALSATLLSAKALLRLQHISGLCLIGTAIYEGVRIALHLSQHKI